MFSINLKKTKDSFPVKMKIDGREFKQILVKYAGHWRLYLNTPMRKAAGKDVGDIATFEIEFDTAERLIAMHPKLAKALAEDKTPKMYLAASPPIYKKKLYSILPILKQQNLYRRILNGQSDFF
jgi:Domain of unknown function (DUF1905)